MRGLLILALLCSPVMASAPCSHNVVAQRAVVKQFVHANSYVAPVVLKQVTPYAYYSVGYAIQEQALVERAKRDVRAEFKQEIATLKELLRQQQGLMPVQPEVPLGLAVLRRSCVKCHTPESKPVIASGAPILFDADGNLTATPEQIGSIRTAVKQGIMPPAPAEPLSDDDYLAVKTYLSK